MISVIIPTLNEEGYIEKTIRSARKGNDIEIIVADSGSTDRTVEIAENLADKVVLAPQGRGAQMNAGVVEAKGDILLFLHADTILPDGWDGLVCEALKNGDIAGGAFRFDTSKKSPVLRFISMMVNLRSRFMSLPYGDQGIFLRRDIFEKIGGFRKMPIMEDVEMVRSIKKLGRLQILKAPVTTSSRRWEKEGWILTTARNLMLLFLYLLGVPAKRLGRLYGDVR